MHSNDSTRSDPIIQIADLDFAYNGQRVLEEVNLEVWEGDFIAMIGPNGGGKTTLLRLMLGLLKPERGRIRVMGKPATRVSHHIGYVPQDVHINRSFPITALDVVLMGKLAPGKRWSKNTAQDRRDALEALERIDMAELCPPPHRRTVRRPAPAGVHCPGPGHPAPAAAAGRTHGEHRFQGADGIFPGCSNG